MIGLLLAGIFYALPFIIIALLIVFVVRRRR